MLVSATLSTSAITVAPTAESSNLLDGNTRLSTREHDAAISDMTDDELYNTMMSRTPERPSARLGFSNWLRDNIQRFRNHVERKHNNSAKVRDALREANALELEYQNLVTQCSQSFGTWDTDDHNCKKSDNSVTLQFNPTLQFKGSLPSSDWLLNSPIWMNLEYYITELKGNYCFK